MNNVKESLYSRKKKSAFSIFLDVFIVLLVLTLLFEIYFVQTFKGIYVIGDSMSPTLTGAPEPERNLSGEIIKQYSGGDYVFVNMRSDPDYFDIVVVDVTDSSNQTKYIIKRVVAFGGDTVYMEKGQLYLKKSGEDSFTAVEESYVAEENNTPELVKNSFAEHTVAEGCMYLLGDNRDYSADSRANGDYGLSQLIGVVTPWSMTFKSQITAFYTFFNF